MALFNKRVVKSLASLTFYWKIYRSKKPVMSALGLDFAGQVLALASAVAVKLRYINSSI